MKETQGTPEPNLMNVINNQSSQDLNFVTIKADLEGVTLEELDVEKHLIAHIPVKTIKKFEDPYKYSAEEELEEGAEGAAAPSDPNVSQVH